MTSLPAFHADRSASEAHGALRRSLEIADRAQHCAVLWFGEILRRRLYRDLGYSSMNQYAERGLGFSRSKTGDFLRLAARLEELPVLKESVAAGRVPYTKAREVIRVATPRTEARRPRCRRARGRSAWARRRSRGRAAMPSSSGPVSAPAVRSRPRCGARCSNATAIAASRPAVRTRGFWRSITSGRWRAAAGTRWRIW